MKAPPKVFISYSHDSAVHKEWVLSVAERLVKNGVDVILNQWELRPGVNLPNFMENSLSNSDRVLVVCTDNYNKKSNARIGGVGYEQNILTAELLLDQDTTKFIPIVKGVTASQKMPSGLGCRVYIDFSDETKVEESFEMLLREIHSTPAKPKPPLGKNPFLNSEDNEVSSLLNKNHRGEQIRMNLLSMDTQAKLSSQAQTLLKSAITDPQGEFMTIGSLVGTWIQTEVRNFGEGGGREEAFWMSALQELESRGYVVYTHTGNSGGVSLFKVTNAGWIASDAFSGEGRHPE